MTETKMPYEQVHEIIGRRMREIAAERVPIFETATEVHYPPQTGCVCGCNDASWGISSPEPAWPKRRHVEPRFVR
jgi:hypothetical protein